jgi:cytochrome c biogenesis protein CcmG/thiol:disulfide interchange protein DsbE
LQRAYQAYKDKGVLFLGVFTMSKKKDIKKFTEKYRITYPVGLENGIAEVLGAKGIPETFFIAKDGRIASKITSTVHFSELTAGIEEILQ